MFYVIIMQRGSDSNSLFSVEVYSVDKLKGFEYRQDVVLNISTLKIGIENKLPNIRWFIEVGISKEQTTAIESIKEVRKLLLTYLSRKKITILKDNIESNNN